MQIQDPRPRFDYTYNYEESDEEEEPTLVKRKSVTKLPPLEKPNEEIELKRAHVPDQVKIVELSKKVRNGISFESN